ncbi:DUF6655 family protein [Roseimaritima sediminicola]|uniref:DUF6655 family protein n=1 Tax=Roseimaritima sediminicola TaxID=2662066 RepID=UPI0012983DBA|nr:DUF6655 family protein [Roseimaritima sediminicola]
MRLFSACPACRTRIDRSASIVALLCAALVLSAVGCGTTKMHEATDQMVLSEAVDHSIAAIDFRPLAGQKVYLDTTYIRQVKGAKFVNADYIVSALRQQVVAAGCLLQENQKEADLIIEARCGTLGADGHQTTYGIPASNVVSSAASLIPSAPSVPTIPEISLARRESSEGAAKIAAFAYDRETRTPVWQSGTSQATASAKDVWVLGVGPFQGGTIRERTRFVAGDLEFGKRKDNESPVRIHDRPPVDYTAEVHFDEGWPLLSSDMPAKMLKGKRDPESEEEVAVVGFEEAAEGEEAKPAEQPAAEKD